MRRDSIINSLSRAGVYWIDEEIKGHSNQKGKHYGLDHVCQQERTPQTMAHWGEEQAGVLGLVLVQCSTMPQGCQSPFIISLFHS